MLYKSKRSFNGVGVGLGVAVGKGVAVGTAVGLGVTVGRGVAVGTVVGVGMVAGEGIVDGNEFGVGGDIVARPDFCVGNASTSTIAVGEWVGVSLDAWVGDAECGEGASRAPAPGGASPPHPEARATPTIKTIIRGLALKCILRTLLKSPPS